MCVCERAHVHVWFLPSSLYCYMLFEKLNNTYAGAQHLEFGESPVLRDREKKKEKGSRKKGIKKEGEKWRGKKRSYK